MSGQQMDHYAWHAAPPSTSVTGTSELFSSTFAMLSDTAVTYPEQWAENNRPAVTSLPQAVFFDQPQSNGQPSLHSGYDPSLTARYDVQYGYRQPTTYPTLQAMPPFPTANYPPRMFAPQPQYPSPYYQPPVAQQSGQLLMAQPQMQQQQLQQQLQKTSVRPMRIEPMHPMQSMQASPMLSQSSASRQSSGASAVSPSDDASMNSPTVTSSDSVASGTPPLCGDAISTDLEGTDEERVMCMACRGVYPSRRSLTGHIGRNEKCREIIGRNYLDQVAAGCNPQLPGTESAIKSGAITNGQDGMSPVCPYCDRFISHYKGNIRRHINQCCKNGDGVKRQRADKEKGKKRRKTDDSGNPPELKDGFEPVPPGSAPPTMVGCSSLLASPPLSPTSSFYGHQRSDMCSPNSGVIYNSQYGVHSMKPNGKKEPQAGDVSCEYSIEIDGRTFKDAYLCDTCDFVTVYKGNMKRHLNTCHPVPECKNLKEWDRKLESMRASVMGINREELQSKLSMHKQNSTRGRKPRSKKKDNQSSEESEPMTDYEPNSNSNFVFTTQTSFAG